MMRALFIFILCTVNVLALKAGVVKGVVKDTTGQPLPYVVVHLKNSAYGVNTNLGGAYLLELKPGTHTLVYSYIGYLPQEKTVTVTEEKQLVVNVTLKVNPKLIAEVEVVAKGDRDKGREIMKKVIDKRDDYYSRVENYKCRTYQKSSLEKLRLEKTAADSLKAAEQARKDSLEAAIKENDIDTTSKKYKKQKKKADEEKASMESALRDKQLNLIESVSDLYFKRPNKYKEVVYAYHDYADNKQFDGRGASATVEYGEHEIAPVYYAASNPYLLISDGQSMDFNFYKNQLDVPAICSRPLLTPASGSAFLNYKFDFLYSFVENGKTIHKINVNPLFTSDALFSGSLFIEDSTWAIVSVNLNINRTVLLYCYEFRVIQDYKEVSPGIYMPSRREFLYTIKEGKQDIICNTRIDHSEYVVNGEIPKNVFNDEIKHYEVDAFDKDSAYWLTNRTIELEDKEIKYISEVDSLAAYYDSPEYHHKTDSIYNHIDVWSFLLNGVPHRNRAKGWDFYIDPLISQMVFYGVGGYRHRLGGSFNQEFKNNFLLETQGNIDYGFLNKDVRGKVGVGLTYYPLKFVRTFVRFGDYYDMVNNFSSLSTLFSRSNYVRAKEISVAQRMEIVNGLFGELILEHVDQSPLTDLKLEQWSQQLFGDLNQPVDFERYIKTEVRLELKYRFKQKYIIKKNKKIIVGTKYPEVRFFYRKGIPNLFDSEINFDYIEAGSLDEMKLGRWGTSNWNVLFGAFVNKKNLRLLEHKYFRGSDSFIFSDPVRSFQLLGPTVSTANSFMRLNYIHHFEGAFGSKIPWISKLKITSAVGGGTLMVPDANFYHQELFVGLERVLRIRKQLFRVGVFAVTADNNLSKAAITYKFGVSFYNSFTRSWSY
jgi:hypothetical protein